MTKSIITKESFTTRIDSSQVEKLQSIIDKRDIDRSELTREAFDLYLSFQENSVYKKVFKNGERSGYVKRMFKER
jgi:predicted transcriptional regulator